MTPIIRTVDLRMAYRVGSADVPVLRGVNLDVPGGEFLAIMGPSGCGKSTLLHLLGGLLQPLSGNIFIDGTDLTKLNDSGRTEVRRKKIGYVFQKFNLLPTLNVRDNLNLAKKIHGNGSYSPERTNEILDMLGLSEKTNHHPSELSVGEQQRVSIARAIINKPRILLADEPTGSLDSGNSRMVLKMLQDLNATLGQTIVMITHDYDAASAAARMIEMRDGRIVLRVEAAALDSKYEGFL
ncbi:MAG: ABC transporter ATP-binding protein [Acidobacteria bacterium]|nr:ABC transporter ATP-binding protein [Acidobacteriota bacterium]MBI3657180.1 ABC transporter ATP-binding protein [Acidobacteriota bacterium]